MTSTHTIPELEARSWQKFIILNGRKDSTGTVMEGNFPEAIDFIQSNDYLEVLFDLKEPDFGGLGKARKGDEVIVERSGQEPRRLVVGKFDTCLIDPFNQSKGDMYRMVLEVLE